MYSTDQQVGTEILSSALLRAYL